MATARHVLALAAAAILVAAPPALAASPSSAAAVPSASAAAPEPEPADAAPDPLVAAGLTVGAPVGLLALSMATPYKELMFLAPLTYGAGHLYAGDRLRAASMSLGGYGAAVAGAGLAVGVVSLWPGTAAESLSRVLWGGALGAVGFGPYAAWDAMRAAKAAKLAEE